MLISVSLNIYLPTSSGFLRFETAQHLVFSEGSECKCQKKGEYVRGLIPDLSYLVDYLLFFNFRLPSLVVLTACGKDSPSSPSPPQQPTSPPPPPAPVATRIEITPSTVSIHSVGQTLQLTATVFDQRNDRMSVIPVVWSSSDVRVVSIDSNRGLLTARGPGTSRITARSLTLSASKEEALSFSSHARGLVRRLRRKGRGAFNGRLETSPARAGNVLNGRLRRFPPECSPDVLWT